MKRYVTPVKKKFTVFLSGRDYTEPQALHCSNCGRVVAQTYSNIKMVIDGTVTNRTDNVPIIVQCRSCRSKIVIL